MAATDDERRCVVRDLHDGAQARLVHTVITLKLGQRAIGSADDDARALVTEAPDEAEQAWRSCGSSAHGMLPSS